MDMSISLLMSLSISLCLFYEIVYNFMFVFCIDYFRLNLCLSLSLYLCLLNHIYKGIVMRFESTESTERLINKLKGKKM